MMQDMDTLFYLRKNNQLGLCVVTPEQRSQLVLAGEIISDCAYGVCLCVTLARQTKLCLCRLDIVLLY